MAATRQDRWRRDSILPSGNRTAQVHSSRSPWWDVRQYVNLYRDGNRTLPEIARGLFYLSYYYGTLRYLQRQMGRPCPEAVQPDPGLSLAAFRSPG